MSETPSPSDSLRPVKLSHGSVFPGSGDDPYIEIQSWTHPITYFVGRNGSGKSRTARAINKDLGGRLLATDRLVGLMSFDSYNWGPVARDYRGIPLGESGETQHMISQSREQGIATEQLFSLREEPEVWLRVAAFIRRTLGRTIELRESAGFLDPYVRVNDTEYSLLRDEGHGLRELVVLLTAAYRSDSPLLVVDEPELHLHPSLARLWLTELNRECKTTGRRAIVVTHNPSFVRPKDAGDLEALWHFQTGRKPLPISAHIIPVQTRRIAPSLAQNPSLVSDLVFSPRPVLVEGVHDVAALTTASRRCLPPEVVSQTDYIECGGSGGVALWLEISKKMGIDVRAVADLDALFTQDIQRVMNNQHEVQEALRGEFKIEPPTTIEVLRPLIRIADKDGVPADPRSRAQWLANQSFEDAQGLNERVDRLLEAWQAAGMWLHRMGTLESVLGIEQKGTTEASTAAETSGQIDLVAEWCGYELDPAGTLRLLLNLEVERIAHSIMEAQRESPDVNFSAPVGEKSRSAAKLVSVKPLGNQRYRISVIAPRLFAGYWVEFDRSTSPDQLELKPPTS